MFISRTDSPGHLWPAATTTITGIVVVRHVASIGASDGRLLDEIVVVCDEEGEEKLGNSHRVIRDIPLPLIKTAILIPVSN